MYRDGNWNQGPPWPTRRRDHAESTERFAMPDSNPEVWVVLSGLETAGKGRRRHPLMTLIENQIPFFSVIAERDPNCKHEAERDGKVSECWLDYVG